MHFRYRGYYYDDETSFYYLQSRYYDPSICRFISADQYELVGTLSKSLGELNLYSYCANNPIMYTDESGEGIIFTLAVIFGVIGVVAGGIYFGNIAYSNGYRGLEAIGITVVGSILGGTFGTLIGCLTGLILPEIGAFHGSSFTLFNMLNEVGELVAVSVSGAQLAEAVALGLIIGAPNIMYSSNANRFKPKDTRSNSTQNKEFNDVANEYNLNKDQRDRLHHKITKRGCSREEIIEWIKKLFPNNYH